MYILESDGVFVLEHRMCVCASHTHTQRKREREREKGAGGGGGGGRTSQFLKLVWEFACSC